MSMPRNPKLERIALTGARKGLKALNDPRVKRAALISGRKSLKGLTAVWAISYKAYKVAEPTLLEAHRRAEPIRRYTTVPFFGVYMRRKIDAWAPPLCVPAETEQQRVKRERLEREQAKKA